MASTITKLVNSNFGGIRRKDSMFSSDKITCKDCQNVELYYTGLNSGVGIRTAKGNSTITNLIPVNENVIGIFESTMLGKKYFLIYTEDDTEGRLYNYNIVANTLSLILDGLTATSNCAGCDFQQGWLDMFIFSNGVNVKYIYCNTETGEELQVETDEHITLIDTEGREVKGLGLVSFDSRLWIFSGKVLWYSQKGECRNFQYQDPSTITSAGFIERVKDITAIYPYLGSLAVFHNDSSVLVQLDENTGFKQTEESPGGCANHKSLVFHGTDLYFYDDTKKGVFSFKQIVIGDKTLGDNIALDIQEELMNIEDVSKIKALSVVTSDRNEVWFLINNNTVMIFDYLRGEWVKRVCQNINTIGIYNNKLYSAYNKIYEEYVGNDFDGEYIEHFYTCTILNLGEDNTLKITKFPPRITVDNSYRNNFWVKYSKNYEAIKEPKKKLLEAKTIKNIMRYDSNDTYDSDYIYIPRGVNAIIKMPSATFKALEITFYTNTKGQEFCIKSIEFSKLKVKQI